jgi:hypothetical protein
VLCTPHKNSILHVKWCGGEGGVSAVVCQVCSVDFGRGEEVTKLGGVVKGGYV